MCENDLQTMALYLKYAACNANMTTSEKLNDCWKMNENNSLKLSQMQILKPKSAYCAVVHKDFVKNSEFNINRLLIIVFYVK